MERDGVTYALREDVKDALDVLETARADTQIDRVLRSATDSVEGLLGRRFYPEVRTQTFDWPDPLGTDDLPWTLYFDRHDVVSLTSVTSGGTTIAPTTGYLLKPDDGPPYTRLELVAGSSAVFETGDAGQQSVTAAGTFSYDNEETPAGALSGAVNSSVTTVTVTDGSLVGIGALLRIGTERLVVTGRTWTTSAQTITAGIASASAVTVTVSSGAAFHENETILIDGERMRITDVAGNTLTVKRAWDGSTLAAHTSGTTVYVSRALTVVRGALGTTAASHSDADTVVRQVAPALVVDLTIAEAMAQLLQERTGYARTIGAGDKESEVRGVGLADLRQRAVAMYGRNKRGRAA